MKKKSRFLLILSLIFTLSSCGIFGACEENDDNPHEHEYTWYVAKEATCTSTGIMEGLCQTCGTKTFLEVSQKEHSFQNGFCSVCETAETDDYIKVTAPDVGWSFQEIYTRAALLGFFVPPKELKQEFRLATLKDIIVTNAGHIKVTSVKDEIEYTATLRNIRENFDMKGESKEYIYSIATTGDGAIHVTFADGALLKCGYAEELQLDSHANPIQRILVNLQNEVVFIYANGVAKRIGIIPNDELNVDEGVLIYKKHPNNTYSIYGALSPDLTAVTIPSFHRGKEVRSIKANAFQRHMNLKTVIIPSCVTTIGESAFPDGTKVFTDATSPPWGWNWFDNYAETCKLYLAGTWELIDGVPTPIV